MSSLFKCLLSFGGQFSKNICQHMLNLHGDACCVYYYFHKLKKRHCLALGFFFSSIFEHYTFLRENWQLNKHKRSQIEFFYQQFFCQISTQEYDFDLYKGFFIKKKWLKYLRYIENCFSNWPKFYDKFQQGSQ